MTSSANWLNDTNDGINGARLAQCRVFWSITALNFVFNSLTWSKIEIKHASSEVVYIRFACLFAKFTLIIMPCRWCVCMCMYVRHDSVSLELTSIYMLCLYYPDRNRPSSSRVKQMAVVNSIMCVCVFWKDSTLEMDCAKHNTQKQH